MKKALILLTLLLAACSGNNKKQDNGPKALSGKFVNEVQMKVLHRKEISTDGRYLYTSTYPLNQLSGFGCYESYVPGQEFGYNYSQTLTLLDDGTYHYVYSIIFGNPYNCPDMMSIDVDVYGEYSYTKTDENEYVISLSTPLEGKESYTACYFKTDELWWFGGGSTAKHAESDKENDFELLRGAHHEEYDWYVRSRNVKVMYSTEQNTPNVIHDDLFNSFFLDDVGQFCTY